MSDNRKASFELLRMICIIGIINMHLLGVFGSEASMMAKGIRIVSDSIFNVGVSCFMLLSGYFGIRLNITKLIKLDVMVIFYSFVGLGIEKILGKVISPRDIISCVLPITSGKYWYLSCYFFIALLAPFIERMLLALGEEQHRKMIDVLLFLFYVIPTFLYFQLLNDNGKGIVNLLIVYIIGRYIGLYKKGFSLKAENLCWAYIIDAIIIIGLNGATSFFTKGISTIWSRDCSFFILCAAIILFYLFSKMDFKSKVINCLAKNVLAAYVFSPYIQHILYHHIDISKYDKKYYVGIWVLGMAIGIFLLCAIVESARRFLFRKIEDKVVSILESWIQKIVKAKGKRKMGVEIHEEAK